MGPHLPVVAGPLMDTGTDWVLTHGGKNSRLDQLSPPEPGKEGVLGDITDCFQFTSMISDHLDVLCVGGDCDVSRRS